VLAEATRQLAAVAAKIGETPPTGDHTAAAVILQGFKDLIQQLQSSRQNASRFCYFLPNFTILLLNAVDVVRS
jgi:hypothetical protein